MMKKILIPILFDYYLFSYFESLIPEMLNRGFSVTVVTFDPEVKKRYRFDHPNYRCRCGPAVMRFLNDRSTRLFIRPLVWAGAWIWGLLLKRRYDFAVLPWDNKPIWYAMSFSMPSLVCHNSTEFFDIESTIERDACKPARVSRPLYALYRFLDWLSGSRFLPRLEGTVVKYPPHLFFDRLMGFKGRNYYLGCSGVKFITVTGTRIRDNYLRCGVAESRIRVVGNPSYDGLLGISRTFGAAEQMLFRRSLGAPDDAKIFSLFLSPSSFTETQIREVAAVVEQGRRKEPRAFFVIKFHPKTRPEELDRFRRQLGPLNDYRLISGFTGDEYNTKLVLVSEAIVQKQSTVGFIAMMFGKKIISYDLFDTGYSDDMYRILDASFHATDAEELARCFDMLGDEAAVSALRRRQETACERYCLATDAVNARLCGIIEEYLNAKKKNERSKEPDDYCRSGD